MSTALVRGVPDCFADALTSREARLDATIAREQHASYVQALEEGGFDVRVVPADPDHPDCSFIEDTAIVYRGRALLTRPGHRSRRGEVAAVALALGELVPVEPFGDSGGTLDGGDVLRVGDLVLVGMSRRTNRAGVSRVAEFALPLGLKVQAVPVLATLHLKSGLSAVDDMSVLWHRAACDRSHLEGLEVIEVGGDDPEAANVLRLADGSILVAAHHQATVALLAGRGHRVRQVDVSQFAMADGGVTCMSIRVRDLDGNAVSSSP